MRDRFHPAGLQKVLQVFQHKQSGLLGKETAMHQQVLGLNPYAQLALNHSPQADTGLFPAELLPTHPDNQTRIHALPHQLPEVPDPSHSLVPIDKASSQVRHDIDAVVTLSRVLTREYTIDLFREDT